MKGARRKKSWSRKRGMPSRFCAMWWAWKTLTGFISRQRTLAVIRTGEVSVGDATEILRYIVGLEDKLPVEKDDEQLSDNKTQTKIFRLGRLFRGFLSAMGLYWKPLKAKKTF